MNQKFTLNFGLRYEFKSPIKEANNLWANFDPSSPTGLIQQGSPGHETIWKADPLNFSPRLGFAYDVKGDGKTVIRGGLSGMYSTFTGVMWVDQKQVQNSSLVMRAANPAGSGRFSHGSQGFFWLCGGIHG